MEGKKKQDKHRNVAGLNKAANGTEVFLED